MSTLVVASIRSLAAAELPQHLPVVEGISNRRRLEPYARLVAVFRERHLGPHLGLRRDAHGVEQPEPRPRALIRRIGTAARAHLETDRRRPRALTGPRRGHASFGAVPVLDVLSVDLEKEARHVGIELRRREPEPDFRFLAAGAEEHFPDSLGRFELPEHRGRRPDRYA